MHLRMLVDPIQRPYRVAVPPGVPGRQPIAPPDLCIPAHVPHYLTTWSQLIRIGLNITILIPAASCGRGNQAGTLRFMLSG